jgi:hypothetical protein
MAVPQQQLSVTKRCKETRTQTMMVKRERKGDRIDGIRRSQRNAAKFKKKITNNLEKMLFDF